MSDNIGEQLVQAVQGGEATPEQVETQVATEQAQEAPVEQQTEVQQFDPTQFNEQFASQSEMINQLTAKLDDMSGKIPEPPKPEPTDDELAIAEVKRQMGIDGLEEQLAKQQELINQQNQALEQAQQFQQAQQAEKELASIQQEYPNFDAQVMQQAILDIAQGNQQVLDALNNPTAVRSLLAKGIGLPNGGVQKPDNITAGSNSTDISSTANNALERVQNGQGSQQDFGEILASFV